MYSIVVNVGLYYEKNHRNNILGERKAALLNNISWEHFLNEIPAPLLFGSQAFSHEHPTKLYNTTNNSNEIIKIEYSKTDHIFINNVNSGRSTFVRNNNYHCSSQVYHDRKATNQDPQSQ